MRTARTRGRPATRRVDSGEDDVEEAADDRAEREREHREQQIHSVAIVPAGYNAGWIKPVLC